MAKRSKRATISELAKAYEKDLAVAWKFWNRNFSERDPYAFVLYGVEGHPRLTPHVLTNQDLAIVAKQYVNRDIYETLEEAIRALRYSVADSPAFDILEQHIPTVDALVEPQIAEMDDVSGYRLLAKAAMKALKKLDDSGLFGTADERERLLIIIVVEGTEEDWTVTSARQLNPHTVLERFEADTAIEGEYTSCDALALSPDGCSLYSTGAGKPHSKHDEDDYSSEIVAYDLCDSRLARRWTYEFPRFGDSGRGIACSPDGQSIVLLRAKYDNSERKIVLMRFDHDRNIPVKEATVPGEPTGFALSPNGDAIAVACLGGELFLLDSSFFTVAQRRFDATPRDVCFLYSGDMLVATDGGVLLVDCLLRSAKVCIDAPAFTICLDNAKRRLVVSQFYAQKGAFAEAPPPTGIDVYDIASMSKIRTFSIPEHEAAKATISPDGQLVAFEASAIGSYTKHFVVVFDIESGEEICRKKFDNARQLTFFPDNRILAVAISGFTTGEPVELWSVIPA